jgi:hypothetical protein
MKSILIFLRILFGRGEQVTDMNGYYVIQYLKAIGYEPVERGYHVQPTRPGK